MKKRTYKEEQRFRRLEVFALLALLLLGTSYHFVELYVSDAYDPGVLSLQYALIALILVGAFIYLRSIRLILKIDEEGVQYQYFPLHYRKHKVKWDEIESFEFIDTPVSTQLSGWAVRLGTWERMFSVSGRTGLSLNLKNGQQLFIGTQHPDELESTLSRMGLL